jgi:hypothetical protein
MDSGTTLEGRVIRAKYPSTCSRCFGAVEKGESCYWIASFKTVTCMTCHRPALSPWAPPPAPGLAGWSADVLASHRGSAGASYAKGAAGERVVGEVLDTACAGIGHVLHDRKLPGSKRNIDHVVVTGAGVFVVDAKNVAGVPRGVDFGGSLTTDARLYVGKTDRSTWVTGVQSLAAAAREAAGVPVTPILCLSASH